MKSPSRSYSRESCRKSNACRIANLIIVAIFIVSGVARADWHTDARPKMGTEVSVYFWHESEVQGNAIVDEVYAEVDRINALMSTYVETSLISDINRPAADEAVFASEELFQLIRRSLDISVLTRGAFDITYDSVGQHYDFRERRRPDDATVEAERRNIGTVPSYITGPGARACGSCHTARFINQDQAGEPLDHPEDVVVLVNQTLHHRFIEIAGLGIIEDQMVGKNEGVGLSVVGHGPGELRSGVSLRAECNPS